MSEQSKKETTETTKLCPYRPSVESDTYELQHKIISSTIGFAPCLQDKCALWRIERRSLFVSNAPDVGYCGISWRP